MRSFRQVIELWGTREAMAADVGAEPASVSKWWQRNSIPGAWWVAVSSTEIARKTGVSLGTLASIADRARATG